MAKPLIKVGRQGTHLNIIKVIYDKPTANIILKGESWKSFKLREKKKKKSKGWPVLPLLFNILFEDLITAISQEKEIKGIQIGREEIQLSLFADGRYIENPEVSTPKLLEQLNEFCKLTEYKINIQKSVAFLYTNNIKKRK